MNMCLFWNRALVVEVPKVTCLVFSTFTCNLLLSLHGNSEFMTDCRLVIKVKVFRCELYIT